ncbi:MAG: ABC transporter ATP-binding protein [Candidatus Sumerlaeia bacterium]|nr:ABC transporter ATP-binding protein [Candidatus Sumerlaeia bacterium]
MRIDVHNLVKRYGATLSLDGVSFAVPEGSVVGLLGPNGAGKSTTIRILTGLARPGSGSATIGGFDSERDHAAIRARLGYLPELAPTYPDMTVEDFLGFMAGVRRIDGARARGEVDRVCALLDLGGWRGRLLRNLSKGTRQRAGIAQALLGEPSLVILDEPTAGLDPAQILEVRRIVAGLRGRATVLLSTHQLAEAEAVCDRVVVLNGGRVVLEGALAELTAAGAALALRYRGDRAALARELAARCPEVRAADAPDGAVLLGSDAAPEHWRARAAAAAVAAGELLALEDRRPTLESLFVQAVAKEQRIATPAA